MCCFLCMQKGSNETLEYQLAGSMGSLSWAVSTWFFLLIYILFLYDLHCIFVSTFFRHFHCSFFRRKCFSSTWIWPNFHNIFLYIHYTLLYCSCCAFSRSNFLTTVKSRIYVRHINININREMQKINQFFHRNL